jgi:catechol 2,3-dioxygenase-like lactoylglutathione lyase family enzyme
MKIQRVTVVTLGVADLNKATEFYEKVLYAQPNRSYDGISFIELPGTWIALFPLDDLAKDISPEVQTSRTEFSGITLAHNANSKDDVIKII